MAGAATEPATAERTPVSLVRASGQQDVAARTRHGSDIMRPLMRRRWPWILFVCGSLLLAGGFQLLGQMDAPPDEDGRSVIPLLRTPPADDVFHRGPIPLEPLRLDDVVFRVSFRWLEKAPTPGEMEAAARAAAKLHLSDFVVQPRPEKSWSRAWWRIPLVPAPGFEFTNVTLPMNQDLSHYETATSEHYNLLASGQRLSGDANVTFTRDLFIVDFHVRGDEVVRRMRSVDAFIIEFAEKTHARIKSNERMRQASADEIRERRMNRWWKDMPFGPSYVGLVEYSAPNGMRVLATEQSEVLALPELWVAVPEGVLTTRERHLLIAAVLQRFVENPKPDAAGIAEVDLTALKHPDIAAWATATMGPGATGKLRLTVVDRGIPGRRILLLRPEGDAARAICVFVGCALSASFGQ